MDDTSTRQTGYRLGIVTLVLVVALSPAVGVVSLGGTAAAAPGDALYQANAGGSFSTAGGAQWDPLTDYLVSGGEETSSHGQPSSIDDSVPDGTPSQIWETERWDPDSGDEMNYEFDVPSGTQVEVRLYFYDGYSGTSAVGDRVFDVSVEDQTIENFDIIETYGDDTGAMESFTVTSDGTIDVDFAHVTENPQINAIEIVETGPQAGELGGPDSVDFGAVVTGNSTTETVTVTNLGGSGDASIDLTGVSVTGTDASDFAAGSASDTTLAPGESADVPVTFTPSSAEAKSATLEVAHDAPNTSSPLTVDLSGEGVSDVPVGFGSSDLQNFGQGSLTALEFGPDGRLYVAQQDGDVYALEVERTGENAYSVVNQEQISAVKDIPNHDDNGNYVPGEGTRQVTGLTVGGTAAQPVVYVSSSDPTIDVGTDDDDTDTNSGAISRLTFDWNSDGSLASVDHDVMVLGLPRSEENHATNGLDLSDDGDTLYVAQGGHTNKGAPSNNFGHTPEYALSASVLSIDLAQIESNYQAKNLQSYDPQEDLSSDPSYPDLTFYYAIPTIQTDDSTDGDDLPFGGNDGVNMAKWVENGPVQVYSSGYRNPYDLVLSEDDQLYVIDNGPNGGWGGQPVDEGASGVCTNAPSESGDYGTGDQLHLATEGSYGGHAAPIRGNPTGADIYDANGNLVFDINSSNSPVPSSEVDPVECDYQDPTEDNSIGSTFGWTGGIEEYTASNFGGAMQGDLLVVEGGSTVERVELDAAGDGVTDQEDSFFTPGSALGIEATGDGGPFPGTVWTARGDITVFEPNDYDGSAVDQCTGADDPSLDEDGDGYDNADELDAGTDPCSAASTPPDFDGDGTSNLNDPDDDNDGAPDTTDPFAVDPDNGTTTTLPVQDDFSSTSLFGDDSQVWTGLMTNGQDDYQDLYDPDQMTVGGAAQVLTVENVPSGDAVNNDQQYAFQFGVDAPDEPFTVSTTVNGMPESPSNYQGMGIYVGNGDQDNYVKLITAANGGTGGIQFGKETDGGFSNIAQPDDPSVTGPATNTDLQLTIDPTTDPNPSNGVDEVAVNASYAVNGSEMTAVGSGAVPASWFDSSDGTGLAVGVISTSYQSGSTFDATWTDIEVATVAGQSETSADVTVTEGGGVDASTYSSGSFEVTNTGETDVSSVTIDLSESAIPDTVFDPDGTAGDSTAKGFTPDSGSSTVGLVDGTFSNPHNGVDGTDGYDTLTVTFDDFQPGETFTFSADVDPTSIKGVSSTGGAGSVSGLELSGSAVTVESSSATVQSDLFTDGSAGGSQATADGDVPAAPTLGVSGATLESTDFPAHGAATVDSADQTLTVSGPAGATVEVVEMEAGITTTTVENGYDIDPYEANDVSAVSTQTVTLDSNGEATVDVSLTESNLHYYVASVVAPDGDTGETSETVILDYEQSTAAPVVFAVNAGGSNYTATDGTEYWADTNFDGGSTYSTSSAIGNTTDDTLYQTERYGDPFGYDVPVENGTYEVTLQFAEIYQGTANDPGPDSSGPTDGTNENDRLFNASLEGEQVLTNYDIYADVGSLNATQRTYTVEVTDGTLNVDFEATYDNAKVSAFVVREVTTEEPTDTPPNASVAVTPGEGVDATTYTSGSYQVTNTGDSNVTTLTFDLSSTMFPDMVFDPYATAGDNAGKEFSLDSGDVTVTDVSYETFHNGENDSAGYDVLAVTLTGFEPGETMTFSIDNDPTSITSTTLGSQAAGPVSGLELVGGSVAAGNDAGTVSSDLATDGSGGGSQATLKSDVAGALTIGVDGVALAPTTLSSAHTAATVAEANQTVTVSGAPANAEVTLLRVEGELNLSNVPDPYDVEAYEANKAVQVETYTVTTNGDGEATVDVTLTNSTADGGLNYFVATATDADGADGLASNYVVLEYDSTATAGPGPVGDFADPPTDPDGDGVYEDVNGDGTVNVGDAQALFAFLTDPVVQNNPSAFDVNGDGVVNVGDAQALFAGVSGGA